MLLKQNARPICRTPYCTKLVKLNGKTRLGFTKYYKYCSGCCKRRYNDKWVDKSGRINGYRKHKGPTCERCGFIPEHKCQLDVDHVDGDHTNNEVENLQTLCANCHRLKTARSKEGMYKKHK